MSRRRVLVLSVALGPAVAIALACGGDAPLGDELEVDLPEVDELSPPVEPAPTAQEVEAAPQGGSRCDDDVIRVDLWSGEYPTPVVHVERAVEVPAWADPCAPEPTTTCALEPGVYHPWGEGEAFATVRPVERYRATGSFRLGTEGVKEGQEVVLVTYLAEGYCQYRVGDATTEAMCPGVRGDVALEAVSEVDVEGITTQWMQPGCGAWVLVDDALLAREGIGEGTIVGFGAVGP